MVPWNFWLGNTNACNKIGGGSKYVKKWNNFLLYLFFWTCSISVILPGFIFLFAFCVFTTFFHLLLFESWKFLLVVRLMVNFWLLIADYWLLIVDYWIFFSCCNLVCCCSWFYVSFILWCWCTLWWLFSL